MTKQKPSPAVTHFPSPIAEKGMDRKEEEKIHLIAEHFEAIMKLLGLDLENDSLQKTPERVARMYVQEIFSGLDQNKFPEMSFFQAEVSQPHMVLIKVSFTSFCEHHFIPMTGIAYVAYIPKSQIIGLSKVHRLVRYFAKRPQLQERLTAQVADSLAILLKTEDVAVSIHARHFCVLARGIEDENAEVITNVLRGEFDTNEKFRKEFFEGINRLLT